jgi:Tol biopolymer transport system component
VAAVLAVALAAVSFIHFREAPPEARLMITSILPPENTSFDFAGGSAYSQLALSPDGRRIVFPARGTDGEIQLWVRPLDSSAAQMLVGTEGGMFPFWSPDSRSIAFFADGKLKRIEVTGGPALILAEAPLPFGGSWSPQGVIVFAPNMIGGSLQRVAADGGVATAATTFQPDHSYDHHLPWFLPDGRHFLFTDQTEAGAGKAMLRIGALDSPEVKTIGPVTSHAVYSSGYLLYLRENALMAQPFDEKRLEVAGEAQSVAEHVWSASTGPSNVALFSVSREGLLAYETGEAANSRQLTWFDRSGKRLGMLGDAGEFGAVDFSPDRKSVAVTRRGQNNDIWIYDVARGLATRHIQPRFPPGGPDLVS